MFYKNLDEFRYEVSGIEKPKDISGFERVSATILGTIVGGPMFGAAGAAMGFGEIAKRSALMLGASFALALTPLGLPAFTAVILAAEAIQLVTGGKALTEKYKKKIKDGFMQCMKDSREDNCEKYAVSMVKDVRDKFNLICEALDNEIKMEKSKVRALEDDRDKNADERERKLSSLKQWERDLDSIERALTEVGDSIG